MSTGGVIKTCCDVVVAFVGVVGNAFHFGDFAFWNPRIAAAAGIASTIYFSVSVYFIIKKRKRENGH